MRRMASSLLASVLPPLALFAAVLLAWHLACVGFSIKPYLLPKPLEVWQAWRLHGGEIFRAALVTGSAALAGFTAGLVVGLTAALTFSQSRLLARAAYPYAVFLQTAPIVAIAPLIVVWFGNGFRSVVIVAFIICLFPIIANAVAGLTLIDKSLLELFSLYRASRWQTLWKLRLPHAVPYIVVGAKTSAGLSVVGAIVGDITVGYPIGNPGLGSFINGAHNVFDTSFLFAALLTSTALGVTVFGTTSLAGAWLTARWRGERPGSGGAGVAILPNEKE